MLAGEPLIAHRWNTRFASRASYQREQRDDRSPSEGRPQVSPDPMLAEPEFFRMRDHDAMIGFNERAR